MNVQLRAWQARFVKQLAAHRREDFLVVACPASGKTIAAGVAAAEAMRDREADQIVVACPTVVVRDQWVQVLSELGYRIVTDFRGSWPEHVHGVCATYAQIANRAHQYALMCQKRRTVAVMDEIHHLAENLAWGDAVRQALAPAVLRIALSGTPFRSDQDQIPFVRYDDDGRALADFSYTYQQAVRDGVCRPVEFRAHDGEITWLDDGEEITATFADHIEDGQRHRRLRASIDPAQPYLRTMLERAAKDLDRLRDVVPDAGGLIVCDNQAHAFDVDRVLNDITDTVPALAISDMPQSHQLIRSFAHANDPWLVSVRMVAEGVDIPRLGIIVWATASKTELMVRQVAGRALRGRGSHTQLPAIVHIPADPDLTHYARHMEVLGGVSGKARKRGDRVSHSRPYLGKDERWGLHKIDPTPFVEWFDRMAAVLSLDVMARRCGWTANPETIKRRLSAWRNQGEWGSTLKIYDACHMAGISFEDLYDDARFNAHREWVANPDLEIERKEVNYGAVSAIAHDDDPDVIESKVAGGVGVHAAPEAIEITTPELPPSPEQLKAIDAQRKHGRAELFKLLGVYTQLRRAVQPGFTVAAAHAELVRAVGPIGPDAPDETVSEAFAWIHDITARLALEHPDQLVALARTKRRIALAS